MWGLFSWTRLHCPHLLNACSSTHAPSGTCHPCTIHPYAYVFCTCPPFTHFPMINVPLHVLYEYRLSIWSSSYTYICIFLVSILQAFIPSVPILTGHIFPHGAFRLARRIFKGNCCLKFRASHMCRTAECPPSDSISLTYYGFRTGKEKICELTKKIWS